MLYISPRRIMSCSQSFLNLGEVEIVFTHFPLKFNFTKNLDILISSLLFRYSIFNDLLFHPPTFEVLR